MYNEARDKRHRCGKHGGNLITKLNKHIKSIWCGGQHAQIYIYISNSNKQLTNCKFIFAIYICLIRLKQQPTNQATNTQRIVPNLYVGCSRHAHIDDNLKIIDQSSFIYNHKDP